MAQAYIVICKKQELHIGCPGHFLGVPGPLNEAAEGHLLLILGPRTEVTECRSPQPLDSSRRHGLGGVLPGLVAVQVSSSNRCLGGGGHQVIYGLTKWA